MESLIKETGLLKEAHYVLRLSDQDFSIELCGML